MTLGELDATMTLLGQKFRDFESKSCAAYQTYELPKEAEKHQRANAKKAARTSTQSASKGKRKADASTPEQLKLSRKKVIFSLSTYKYHSLGDYAANIKMYGTCDSYSTELVSNSTSKASFD
jgi:ribosomal protein L18